MVTHFGVHWLVPLDRPFPKGKVLLWSLNGSPSLCFCENDSVLKCRLLPETQEHLLIIATTRSVEVLTW